MALGRTEGGAETGVWGAGQGGGEERSECGCVGDQIRLKCRFN